MNHKSFITNCPSLSNIVSVLTAFGAVTKKVCVIAKTAPQASKPINMNGLDLSLIPSPKITAKRISYTPMIFDAV